MQTTSCNAYLTAWERLALVCVLATALAQGCSCNRTPDPALSPPSAPEIATLPNLAPEDWALTDWAAKDLDHPPPTMEAELEVIEQGLQVTSHERKGPVHVVLRRPLLDEFEISARVVQPSVEELQEQGLTRPSRFSSLIGFRSAAGNPSFRTHLKRDRDVRETFDIVVRASRQQISFRINEKKPTVIHRSTLATGHFFLEMPKNNRAYIVSLKVRTELEPDPVLVKAAERVSKQPLAGNGFAMQPPPGFFGPGPPMFGPGYAGVGPPSTIGNEPPPPSHLEPLMSQQGWTVPKLGIQHLDTAIAQDLRLEPSDSGSSMTVAKTAASGGFWIVRRIEDEGDFTAAYRVSIPSMRELSSVAGATTLLAVGLYPAAAGQSGLVAPAPPPMPTGPREFNFSIRRLNGRATLDVAGTPMGGSITTDQGILVGLYMRGGIRFSIHDVGESPAAAENSVADAGTRAVEAPAAEPPETAEPGERPTKPLAVRIWTDISGTRQVEATFLKLVGDTAHFRRGDETEVTIPLSGLCAADRLVVRQLAAP